MMQDKLFEVIKNNESSDYNRIIADTKSGDMLYHLSHIRANVVEWLGINDSHSVLEIGSETGVITGFLASRAKQVTCIEESEKNNEINRLRNSKYNNISYITGVFSEQTNTVIKDEQFDFVLLISPIENSKNSMCESGQRLLGYAMAHVKSDGKIVVAVDNCFGLKFLAGNRGNVKGNYFEGLEWSSNGNQRTGYTKNTLLELCKKAGASRVTWYYPYPDYRLPLTVYSDEYLPKCGELTNNYRNFEDDRLYLFDESKAFDNIIREKQFGEFANSYIAIIQKNKEENTVHQNEKQLIFAKYSNDRAYEYNIRTDICNVFESGKEPYRVLNKTAWSNKSQKHIENMYENYNRLMDKYADSGVDFNKCKKTSQGLEFEYLVGKTLDEIIIDAIERKDFDKAKALIQRFIDLVRFNKTNLIWNVDLIFKNIITGGDSLDSLWTVIDYEWTFENSEITPEFIIYRSLYYFIEDNKKSDVNQLGLMDMAGIDEKMAKKYQSYEVKFQQAVSLGHLSLGQIYPEVAGTVYNALDIVNEFRKREEQETLVVYGVKNSENIDTKFTVDRIGETYNLIINVTDCEKVIIEPCKSWCFVNVNYISVKTQINHNGTHINGSMYAFKTCTPYIEMMCEEGDFIGQLEVKLMISNQGAGTSSTFAKLIDEIALLQVKSEGAKGLVKFAANKVSKILNKR